MLLLLVMWIALCPGSGWAATGPQITTAPQNQSVLAGSNAVFTAVASGTGNLSYQWAFNGTNLNDGGRINGATAATLIVSNVTASDAGTYQVTVSNTHGTAATNATLTVLLPPAITSQPVNKTVNIAPAWNTSASFNVTATGTEPLQYQWRFNGVPLSGQTNATLTIDPVQLTNDGNYTVVITNAYGIVTSSVASLTVWAVLQMPQPEYAVWGANASFSVVVTNLHSLPITYKWYVNGNASDFLPGQTNATMVLTNVQPAQAGWYYAQWSSTSGVVGFVAGPLWVVTTSPGVPFIAGFSPSSAKPGATVTISGTNFSPIASSNVVCFGATRSSVISATETNLTVAVPSGATFGPLSVTVGGLKGSSRLPFLPTFTGDGSAITSTSFGARQNLGTPNGPMQTIISDLDGDGKPDLVVANIYAHVVSIFQNVGTPGMLGVNSFAARVDLPGIGGSSDNPFGMTVADVDGDNKPDILVCDRNANQIKIYRNTSAPGLLTAGSFAAPVAVSAGTDPRHLRVADLDGDGKLDLVIAAYGNNAIFIRQNLSTPGNISFSTSLPGLTTEVGVYDVAIGDLDGDGMPDIAAAYASTSVISIWRNTGYGLGFMAFAPYTNFPALSYSSTIMAVDVDGDGNLDLVDGSFVNNVMSVLRNQSIPGALSFAPHVDFGASGRVHDVVAGDINGKGKPDLIIDGELDNFLSVFQNQSTPGSFANASLGARVDFATGWNAWGVSIGDLDDDGRPDAVVANSYDNNISLYQNQSQFGGPPAVILSPTNVIAPVNTVISLTGVASGQAPLSYQWYFNGTNLMDDGRISGSTSASLSIANAQLSDAGSYYFVVSNTLGTATSGVAVVSVIIIPPAITQQPQSLTNLVGNNAAFTAGVTGSEPISYQWFRDGVPLSDDARISGATNTSLTISGLQTNDTAGYWLVVSNAANSATSAVASLTVLIPPSWTLQPVSQTNVTGSNAVFVAAADGSPPLHYQWYFNSSPLNDNARIIGSQTAMLTISNLTTSDTGNYSVAVANDGASITSSNALLTVLVPPAVTTQPLGRSTPLGLGTTFTAAGSGSGPLTYQWRHDSVDIPGATNTSFTLAAVSAGDLGIYQFVVSNAVGVAVSSNAWLTVGPIAAWGQNNYNQCLAPPWLTNVTGFSCAYYYSLVSLSDGSIAAWGNASAFTNSSFTNVVAVSAGYTGALALHADGTVAGSGSVSPLSYKAYPSNVVAVAAGYNHGLALRAEGTVTNWGSYAGTAYIPSSPPGGLTRVTAIAAGYQHDLALRSDGTVVGWGSSPAANVPYGLSNIVAIAAGSMHSLALKADGTLVAWGSGLGTNIPAGLTDVMTIGAGNYFDQRSSVSFAVRSNGTVVAWGLNAYSAITNVPSGLNNVVSVAGGAYHALALVNDGKPQFLQQPAGGTAWSGGDWTLRTKAIGAMPLQYQWLRDGSILNGETNATLLLPAIQVASAGNYQVTVSNALGDITSVSVPLAVADSAPFFLTSPAPTNRPYVGSPYVMSAFAAGSGPMDYRWQLNGADIPDATNTDLIFDSIGWTNGGDFRVIAHNSFGSVTSSVAKLYPMSVVAWGQSYGYGATNVPLTLTNAIAVAAYTEYGMALRADGTVTNWGMSSYAPPGISNVVEIATAGSSHVLGRDGKVRSWNGVTAYSNALAGISNVVNIEADLSGSTLLKADGSIARVTYNGGSIAFPQLTNVITLSRFYNGFAAVRADGTLFTYGGGVIPPISATTNVLDIALENSYGAVLKRDGVIQAWGSYLGLTNWSGMTAVSANAGVKTNGTVTAWMWSPNYPSLFNVPNYLRNVAAVDASDSMTMALLAQRKSAAVLLPDALDTSARVVSSRGSPRWFGQTNISHDGVHAAQSAQIGNNTASSMRMWIQGPITVSFWWKVSSAADHGVLSFSAGGIMLTNISGEVDWQQCTLSVPAGNQILQWTYSKDGNAGAGQDAGWVDQLQLIPQPPTIVSQPVDQSVVGPTNVTLSVGVSGTPPLTYRWWKDGNPIIAPNSASLVMLSAVRTNSGIYSLIITNVAGNVTSSNATLEVRVPQLLGAPVFLPDGTIQFSASDVGGGMPSSDELVNFEVQASTNLLDWVTLPGSLSISNGLFLLQDAGAANYPSRYYRIVEH